MKWLEEKLFKNEDLKYKDFTSRSIPNVDKNTIIGVRLPILRDIAKELNKSEDRNTFINNLPHKYHEENLIHGFSISFNKNIDGVLKELKDFLPYMNNWAVTDTINPQIFKKNLDIVYSFIEDCIKSDLEYIIRFGVVMLLKFYLDDKRFINRNNKLVLSIKKDTYYINMAISWYFSFALIKQYDETIKIFKNKKIKSSWIHNKSIQKAIESYRISNDKKEYLKSLKINIKNIDL